MEQEKLKGRIRGDEYDILMSIFDHLERSTNKFSEDGKCIFNYFFVFTIQPSVFLQREMKKRYFSAEGTILYFPQENCFEYVTKFNPIVLIDFKQSKI
ncbi:MAG: hypothetical protein HYW78_03050 [Parcubacteria group bacterium]|nr:hypothetical protein [Parcubacteria group bacterium]